ncbi:MAG: hypothetical protein KKF56_02985 [Nanoarchaeota archaeon]|nr:hypothetical protein [Nanoarchaeota archaeon]
MGILDFFRRKQEIIEKEKIKLIDIENWTNSKKSSLKKDEKQFITTIKQRLTQLDNELEEAIEKINKIDFTPIKAEDKIKFIVKENLDKYVDYLIKFNKNLQKINETNPSNFLEKLNETLEDFQKKSSLNFEKATFLIGKELGQVKNSISSFFNDLKKHTQQNKELLDSCKTISSINKLIEELSKNKMLENQLIEKTTNIDSESNNLKNEIKTKQENIEKLKNSEEYKENLRRKILIEQTNKQIELDLNTLKQEIDFKELANIYHISEQKMEIVKSHKENFLEAFQKDNGQNISTILEDSNQINESIKQKIKIILEKQLKIQETKINKDESLEIQTQIQNIKSQIQNLKNDKSKELKKQDKLSQTKSRINSDLILELDKLNVEIY